MICVYINIVLLDRDMHTGRMHVNTKTDAHTSQRPPKVAKKPPETRRKALNRFFLTVLSSNQPN